MDNIAENVSEELKRMLSKLSKEQLEYVAYEMLVIKGLFADKGIINLIKYCDQKPMTGRTGVASNQWLSDKQYNG